MFVIFRINQSPESARLSCHFARRGTLARVPAVVLSAVLALMAFASVIAQGTGNAFIYFQF